MEPTTKDFASRLPRDSAYETWLRRSLGLFIGAFLVLGLMAGYRAWVQVFSVRLQTTDAALGPGDTVHVGVKTSGRTFVQVRLELLQSGQAETLAIDEIPKNGDAALDPRPQRRDLSVALPSGLWTRFHSGPALLRATAVGRPQWLRTPPPTVRELTVTLQR